MIQLAIIGLIFLMLYAVDINVQTEIEKEQQKLI